jgi:hypothetical protein
MSGQRGGRPPDTVAPCDCALPLGHEINPSASLPAQARWILGPDTVAKWQTRLVGRGKLL